MSCLKLRILKRAKSDYESPINRSRLLGWADETLSKLKSDRNFLRRKVKKTNHEENASVDSDMTSPEKDKCIGEEISQLKSNEVATYVSEIVTSKMKRKIQHMAFDGSITREKQKRKASDKEHITNNEADENCDKHYELESKHKLNVSCSEDQEGDLCKHEICTRNRKRRKYNEGESQENTFTESLLSDFKERSMKRNKVMEHYRCQGVSCCHFCKCASKESRSQKLKKYGTPEDFYSVNENDSASEKVKNAATCKQDKIKKLKQPLNSILEKGDRLSDADVPGEDLKEKKKEKRYCTCSVSKECISEKKKLKKYKLYTQKYKSDESMSTSGRESEMNDREKEAFEGCCGLCEKIERKKHKHDHTFNKKWEETKKWSHWHSSCKTEFASSRSQRNNGKANSPNTTEYKRKRKSEKDDAYSETEFISERAKEHSEYGCYDDGDSRPGKRKKRNKEKENCEVYENVADFENCDSRPGKRKKRKKEKENCEVHENVADFEDCDSRPGKRKKRKKEKENCEVYENVADFEERGKKKMYSDRSGINAMEASSIQERQKKKHKEAEKDKYLSVYIEGKGKKNTKNNAHKENASTNDNLKTDRNNVNSVEACSTQVKQKKKHKGVEKEISNNLSVDKEERSKKKRKKKRHDESAGTEDNLKTDRNDVNAKEASSVQEKQKKKHKKIGKEEYYNLSVDMEEENKKSRKKKGHEESAGTEDNLKTDRNDVNAMEAPSVQEKQKKKHKKIEKEEYYNLSVDMEEEMKKKGHEERMGTEDNLKTDRNYVNAVVAYSTQAKQKKKHRESEKEIDCNLSVNIEEGSKKKGKKKRHEENAGTVDNLKTDRNDVNATEAPSGQEKQKNKHKEVEKEKYCTLSVDIMEESEKKRHKENVSTDDSQKTDEYVEDSSLLDGASSNTKYSVKGRYNSISTSQRQAEGVESVKSKRNKAVSVISKEKTWNETKGCAIIEGDQKYNQSSESMQSISNLKKNKSNCMQINTLHDKNIEQNRKTSNFGLSPIFRLLATEPDFSNATHVCQTCCRCKSHPDVTLSESAGSVTENIGNVVIKIEPGVRIKQEKEDIDNSEPHIMDQQVLAMKKESQTELDTDCMNGTDDAVRNMESNDIFIDNLTDKKEEGSAGNGIVPNECSVVKEGTELNKTDNEYGIGEYVEGFSDECVVNGNKEADIDTPFHNIYDDKITMKEEIYHLTNTCYYQNDSRNYAEDTSDVDLDFAGKQTAACMGNTSELASVGVLGSTYSTVTNVHRTASAQEVNGLNLDAVLKCEPATLNEPQNRFILDIIPKAANVQNTTWNEKEASSSYWSSVNTNEQQTSQFNDIETFRTGRVNFTCVPTWWKRGRIAKVLGVPVKAVRICSKYYGPKCHKNYVSVNFPNPQCLQKIMSCAHRIPCSRWFVTRGLERRAKVQQRSSESFHQ